MWLTEDIFTMLLRYPSVFLGLEIAICFLPYRPKNSHSNDVFSIDWMFSSLGPAVHDLNQLFKYFYVEMG